MEIIVKVDVPDGEYCGRCTFLSNGLYHTKDCNLFEELFLDYSEHNGAYVKCQKCLDACNAGKE